MPTKVFKVALEGYNAETDTDPNHFSLYVDQEVDYVLIKEKLRGSIEVADSDSENIAHGLDYIPFAIVFAEISSGVWRKILGDDEFNSNNVDYSINTTNLVLNNNSGGAVDFKYYIFYDRMV
jgi:hypothetical protein